MHPAVGFAAGWMFLAAKSASAATAALGCAGYLLHTLGFTGDMSVRVGLALCIVFAMTALVAGGLRRSNHANVAIVGLTLVALAAFVVFGWMSVDQTLLPERLGVSVALDAFRSPATLLQATALMFVAYTGYGRIATLGEEVREPAITIPRAIITTLVVSMLLYVMVAATAVAVAGADVFASSTREAAAPLEVVARSFNVPQVAMLVAVGAVTAMAGVLLNLLLGLSRVLLAMARRRDMPSTFDQVSAATSSPTRAVWAIGAFISLLVLFGDIKTTWSFSAFTVLVYYGITNLSALRLPPEARRYPRVVPVVGLLSCFGLSAFVGWQVMVAGLGLLALGFLLRQFMQR